MGSYLALNNFDEMFHQTSHGTPLIINDILDTLESEKEALDKRLFVTYSDTDLLETIPKCGCGATFGQHLLGPNGETVICRHCGTPVRPAQDKDLEPLIWVRAPIGKDGEPIPIINPKAWRFMTDVFSMSRNTASGFNVIKWLINTDYRPLVSKYGKYMDQIEDMGIERGLSYFARNFDEIIDKLASITYFSQGRAKKKKLTEFFELMSMSRDAFFCHWLPIHNRTIMVIEDTRYGSYMDMNLKMLIESVRNITGIDSEIKNFTVRQKENRIAKLIENIAIFGEKYEKDFITKKAGLARKHMFATRCFWSGRAVINSLSGPHRYDEIHLPWSLAITVFQTHLLGKLMRTHGFGANDGRAFLTYHTYKYHPLIDQLFNELIDECPYDGIPNLFGRNPTMYRLSLQRMFITKVKTDPTVMSISYPLLSITGPNAMKLAF